MPLGCAYFTYKTIPEGIKSTLERDDFSISDMEKSGENLIEKQMQSYVSSKEEDGTFKKFSLTDEIGKNFLLIDNKNEPTIQSIGNNISDMVSEFTIRVTMTTSDPDPEKGQF